MRRHVLSALVLLCLGTVFSALPSPFMQTSASGTAVAELDAAYEPYSAARLSELRAEGKPVFVNMTAAWCITCLVNEKIALSSEAVVAALDSKGVTYMKGDWTNNDPAITAVLREYETAGVPLYLMFPAEANAAAKVMPQLLTESIVLDYIAGL
jgi:thiol:disulfide interchange protein DsbD